MQVKYPHPRADSLPRDKAKQDHAGKISPTPGLIPSPELQEWRTTAMSRDKAKQNHAGKISPTPGLIPSPGIRPNRTMQVKYPLPQGWFPPQSYRSGEQQPCPGIRPNRTMQVKYPLTQGWSPPKESRTTAMSRDKAKQDPAGKIRPDSPFQLFTWQLWHLWCSESYLLYISDPEPISCAI